MEIALKLSGELVTPFEVGVIVLVVANRQCDGGDAMPSALVSDEAGFTSPLFAGCITQVTVLPGHRFHSG